MWGTRNAIRHLPGIVIRWIAIRRGTGRKRNSINDLHKKTCSINERTQESLLYYFDLYCFWMGFIKLWNVLGGWNLGMDISLLGKLYVSSLCCFFSLSLSFSFFFWFCCRRPLAFILEASGSKGPRPVSFLSAVNGDHWDTKDTWRLIVHPPMVEFELGLDCHETGVALRRWWIDAVTVIEELSNMFSP